MKFINCSSISEVNDAKRELSRKGYKSIGYHYHLDLECYQVYGSTYDPDEQSIDNGFMV